MNEIPIRIDHELYRRAKENVDELESSLNERVIGYVKTLNGDDGSSASARARMKELFTSTKGFGAGPKLSREEMHERASVH